MAAWDRDGLRGAVWTPGSGHGICCHSSVVLCWLLARGGSIVSSKSAGSQPWSEFLKTPTPTNPHPNLNTNPHSNEL